MARKNAKVPRPPGRAGYMDQEGQEFAVLKRVHIILASALALSIPIFTALGAYYSAMGAVNQRISDMRTDNAEKYVRKEDFQVMMGDVKQISRDVSEIKGYLKMRPEPKQ